MFKVLTRPFFAILFSLAPLTAQAQTETDPRVELMMGEEPGCIWCARWNEEIGPIYGKTGEGEAAPLRRVDITDPIPEDITLARSVNFTPTFVLLVNGEETGRIEGYPGDDFFWGLLGRLLDDQNISYEAPANPEDD